VSPVGLARLLVVEDDDQFRHLLLRWLEALGAAIYEAATLKAAAAAIRQYAPQVIVLDLKLPDATHLEAIPEMVTAAGPRVPIVVLTGRDDVDRAAVKALGAYDLLAKRVDITADTLRRVVLDAFVQTQRDSAPT
jgi:DNA-binding NtrC family response regulator